MNLKEKLKDNPMNSASKFVGRLFEARDNAHMEHLRVRGTGSFAAHKALNEFYDGILGLADSFIESYQGKYGIIKFDIKPAYHIDFVEYLKEFGRYVEASREMFKEDWLKNQIDTMCELIYSTLYKLENLK